MNTNIYVEMWKKYTSIIIWVMFVFLKFLNIIYENFNVNDSEVISASTTQIKRIIEHTSHTFRARNEFE